MVKEIAVYTLSRAKVLSTLKKYEPLTKEQLAIKSGLSRASVSLHLKTLQKYNLVTLKQNKKTLGKPYFITTNKADPLSLKMLNFFEQLFPQLFK